MRTIDASGVPRTAITGSAALAIETGASTTVTPSGTSPELGGRPEEQDTSAALGGDRRAGCDLGRSEVRAVRVDRDRETGSVTGRSS
jgi:hypothetical protein